MVHQVAVPLCNVDGDDVPESATKISYLFVALPRSLPLISSEDLCFFNLDIFILFIISALVGGDGGVGDELVGGQRVQVGGLM